MGGCWEVGGVKRAFALIVRLELFECVVCGEVFDFDVVVVVSVCVDDVLVDVFGIDCVWLECLVCIASSARSASRSGDVVVFSSGKDLVDFVCVLVMFVEMFVCKFLLFVDVWLVVVMS